MKRRKKNYLGNCVNCGAPIYTDTRRVVINGILHCAECVTIAPPEKAE